MKAEMNNYNVWIESTNDEVIINKLEQYLTQSGFNILEKCEHYFSPVGYTGVWLLAESHFAVHTFPEENKIYVELTSCVIEPFNKMKEFIEKLKMKKGEM